MSGEKIRLDQLVQRVAGVTRSKAQGLIQTGSVRDAAGEPLRKPGQLVDENLKLAIEAGPRYVSRGGEKLDAALDAFKPELNGVIAIDVGASTGGFTDCLLQNGAAKVYAVDVGYGQLDWSLRQDPRVVVLERTNIRHLTLEQLGLSPTFFTVDCSFISLRLVLPPLLELLARPSEGIALIKPQFEAGKELVGKGGVVRDAKVRETVVEDVSAVAGSLGFEVAGVIPSPVLGPAGNQEFLMHLKLGEA